MTWSPGGDLPTARISRLDNCGLLPARRVPLALDFSAFRYDITEDDGRLARGIHERQMRKLSGMSPGLGRYLSRKLGRTDWSGAIRPGSRLDDVREPHLARCPQYGYLRRVER
jgi:hypothetical protein